MRAIAWACAAILAAAIAARFPPLHVPRLALAWVDAAAGAAVFAAVAAEARLPRGDVGPLWMRVALAPRLATALALSFMTTVMAQTLAWSLGPVDPTFASPAPAAVKTMWFFMFTIGFSGVGMMSAPSTLLPVLSPPARLLRTLPAVIAVALYAAVGAGAGVAFGFLVASRVAVRFVETGHAFVAAHSLEVTAAWLALTVGPALLPSSGKDP